MILHKILPQQIIKLTEFLCIFDRIRTYLDKPAGSLAEWLPWATPWDRGTARADSQDWEASGAELLSSVPMQPEMGIRKLVLPHWPRTTLMEQAAILGPPFPQLFYCPHMLRYRHPQSRQWLKASVPPIFPTGSQTTPKEDVNGQGASKTWWDSPHIHSTPSFGNCRSKSLWLFPELSSFPQRSSFTSKWQNSTATVGQALFPRWNKEIWVGALLYQISSDWLQGS